MEEEWVIFWTHREGRQDEAYAKKTHGYWGSQEEAVKFSSYEETTKAIVDYEYSNCIPLLYRRILRHVDIYAPSERKIRL